jgi:hypothetical protein
MYEKVGVELIKMDQAWTERLWELSEDEILDEILKLSNTEDRRVDDGQHIKEMI